MELSSKLTLLILVLPVSIMVLVCSVGFYLYRSSLDASAFSTAVSSLLSAILVILLVWERLRSSLLKKIKYLHKYFLFKLYTNFNGLGRLFRTQEEIRRLKVDLEKYGKFIIISLYPSGLLREVEEFLSLHNEFYKKFQEIDNMAKMQLQNLQTHQYSQYDFFGLLEIKTDLGGQQMTAEEKERYRVVAQTISEQYPKLTSELTTYFEKTRNLWEKIFNKLEDFFKTNKLSLEEEHYTASGHY